MQPAIKMFVNMAQKKRLYWNIVKERETVV